MFRSSLIALALIWSAQVWSQSATKSARPAKATKSKATKTTQSNRMKKVKKVRTRASTFQLRTGLTLWQETIDLKNGGAASKMVSQSLGLIGSAGLSMPMGRSRWDFYYGGDLAFGTIKGKGNNDLVPDELKNQPWYMFGGTTGFTYRTSPVTSLGFMLPIQYRIIKWELAGGSGLDVDRDQSFSLGMSGVYVARLSRRSSLNLSLTHQYLWNATVWNVLWQYDL